MTTNERFETHMSDSDALMWNIEKDPLLRSTIVTVLLLDRPPDWDRLVDKIERGTWLIPRLRQRIATPLLRMGPPQWSGDANFDLRYHLRRVKVCEPTLDAVLDLARTSAMAGFDRARPLWEYTVVEGLEGGRSAMILKVHHSMTDGVGGMKLLLMLFDFVREPEAAAALDRVDSGSCLRAARPRAQRARAQPAARARHRAPQHRRIDRRDPCGAGRPGADGAGRVAGGRIDRPVPEARDRAVLTDHAGAHAGPAAEHARRPPRRHEARREDRRRVVERLVRGRGARRDAPVPRVPRRRRRRAPNGHADQPAGRRLRARRQPLHPGPLPRPAVDQGSGRPHRRGRTARRARSATSPRSTSRRRSPGS